MDRQHPDDLGPAEMAGLDQPFDSDRNQGFQADDPERSQVQLACLLLRRVRGVVGGEDLDRAVHQAANHRFDVSQSPQRGVHLEIRIKRTK